eukprot:CAMPEP_0182588612 /NCGR_PEP_ID=MMETSP1324-20130603/67608_1 /TAXON_ID=236786 /ORGANISM="Florenciella sp., Strain RCC1587" /LENGTH=103 /DNA_ID=CAMNT_0024805703 /DNA_START=34 /DNA_END=342 /DNA_ORIENTATION=-
MTRLQTLLLLGACVGSSAFASRVPRTSVVKPLRPAGAKKTIAMVGVPVDVLANADVGQKLVGAKGMALKIAMGLRGGQVDFATTVAPALGATIANAMFLSGLP